MATSPFTVIIPKQLAEAKLLSSNVPENDYPVWSSTTTYATGDMVIMTTGVHKVYKSLTSGNLNHQPNLDPINWVEVGPTNRWKMFDQSGGTVTVNPSTIQFTIEADRVNSLAFIDILATSVTIVGTVGATEFYNQTFEIQDRAIIENWYDYFFAESFRATELVVRDIPSLVGANLTITVTNLYGNAQVGTFIFGNASSIGATQYGARAGITDYSRKSTDEFGRTTIVERAFSKTMDVNLWVQSSAVDAVTAKLNTLRATPCLWVGSGGNYETLTVYGFYKDYSIDIAYPTYSVISLQIEGLTNV